MGKVWRIDLGGYMQVESSSDDEPTKATDTPPEGEPMVTEVAQVASSDPGPSSTQVHERLTRLEAAVATILENQAWALEHLNRIQ